MSFLFLNVNHDVGYESSESIPISLGYLLAYLKSGGRQGVILDDLRDRPLSFRTLEGWLRRIRPRVVGFTTYQSTIDRVRSLARFVKSVNPDTLMVLGGPQAVAMPAEALEDLSDIDAIVRGEGEVVIREIAQALDRGETIEGVPGLACRSRGAIVDTGLIPEIPDDLDEYPSPYLTNLLNLEGKNTVILLSSRGCRHACRFCITPKICRGRIRYHSIERVLEEMEYLTSQGIERFWFADPNFTDDRDRTVALLEAKMSRGIETPFWCQTRSDLVDPDLLKLLQRAGADTVAFGLESGSPGVLEQTNKRIELERLRENVELIRSLEMEAELFSIFGLPGETIEDARATMRFVQSLGIPIQSNSGSQQMQLYFGSAYERNPERFGIRPMEEKRPRYRSVGERFTTTDLSRGDLRKIRNLWALANEQLKTDVYYKQRVFEILDFLFSNREDLSEEPDYYAYGALACNAIEEFGELVRFLEGYARVAGPHDAPLEELIDSLGFFQETEGPAGAYDRVIFDSRSYMNGVPFTGISGRYWDVLLGRGLLLDSFERGFLGCKPGQEVTFSFVFPDDYDQVDLRNREVKVQAKIHKVFQCLELRTLDEVRGLTIRNRYNFPDLDFLRDQNEILYYFALRDAAPEVLLRSPSHFLMLVHRLAKLGKLDEVRAMAEHVRGKPTAVNALADTLVAAGKFSWALEYYESLSDAVPSAVLKRVRCLLAMDQPAEALALIEGVTESQDVEFLELLLHCLREGRPGSERIAGLQRRVIDLQVQAGLSRERLSRPGQGGPPPIVHGYED